MSMDTVRHIPKPTNQPGSRVCPHGSAAFTLIELLVVAALIGLLAYLAAPAFQSIGRARGLASATDIVTAVVELAHNEAVTRQTYVWLGVRRESAGGRQALQIALMSSKDGTTNSGGNLHPLTRPQTIEGVGLVSSGAAGSPRELASQNNGLIFQAGAANFDEGTTFTFLPTGEVTAAATPSPSDGFEPLLAIGLAALKGDEPDNANRTAIIIDGAVGSATVIRP